MCAQAERGERENKLNFKLINAFFYDNSPWKIIHKKRSWEFTTQRKRARSKQARWRASHTHRASYTRVASAFQCWKFFIHGFIHVWCIVWRVTSSFNKFRTFLLSLSPSSSAIPVTICVCTLRLFTRARSWSARVGSFGILLYVDIAISLLTDNWQLDLSCLFTFTLADCLHVNFRVIYLIYQWR